MNPVRVTLIVQSTTCEYKLNTVQNTHEYQLRVLERFKGPLPWYEGEYEVTPKVDETILETEDRSMMRNLVVKSIPYSSVTNPSGGKTITIA